MDHTESPHAVAGPLGSLVEPVAVVEATTTCADVDFSFRNRWTSSSILIVPTQRGGRPGLVSRSRFLTTMAGSYGYGRSLYGKRPIGDLAAWDAPLLHETSTLGEAAALLADGPDGYHDLVVIDGRDQPVGIVRPVRVMQALADRTAQQAATDHLTGAASRTHLVELLTARLADIGTGTGAVIVAYVDLDRLKAVNDGLGHSWGDALLRSVARRIDERLAPTDVLGRLGGDEFAVVRSLPPRDVPDAEERALRLGEELCKAIAAADPQLPSRAQSRASVGVAVATSCQSSVDAALFAADQAMYTAKAAGGDAVRLAGSSDLRPATWAQARHLEVAYQPIVDTESGSVVAVEALLRQRNADGGLDGPLATLEDAARAGMSLDLDRWVLERSCRDMLGWQERLGAVAPAVVHVNLAADSLTHPGLASAVLATIDATGLPRAHVRLELSERSAVLDLTEALSGLEEIAAAGVGIALDDLGASLDSLRILDRLPIDAIKIDRSVVVGADSHVPIDIEVLSLLVRLGESLGLQLVGEGVEQCGEEHTLRTAGVHLMQGFRYSHAVPAAEIERMACPANA
ncbi:MAG TPA: EAL domain-containing protein [Cellulomonas sp.]